MAKRWRNAVDRQITGVGTTLAIMAGVTWPLFAKVYAADAPAPKVADVVNPINTACMLIAAFFVFGMQVGFTMQEAVSCRSRGTVNVLMECIADTCPCESSAGAIDSRQSLAFLLGKVQKVIKQNGPDLINDFESGPCRGEE